MLPAVIFSCATATAASGGAPADREQASTVASAARDTDHDGLSDSAEVRRYHTDPLERDTDSDRLNDGAEVKRYHTNPRKLDTDGDGLQDGDEVKRYHTNPRIRDTDGDGLRDGDEITQYKTDPRKVDTDGDGFRDSDEINQYKTNPRKADTDGDGFRDSDEINQYKTNPRKADTDGDGFGDRVELRGGTNPLNARSHLGFPDASNTGVPPGTTLRSVGSLTVRANNAVVDAISTTSCVVVNASGVTIKNSKIGCVIIEGAAADPANPRLTVQDTEINCGGPGSKGIQESNFNAYRVDIHNCEDGLYIDTNVTIKDSYIHDLATSDTAHNDGIQGTGLNTIIEHNTIYGVDTSALNINNNSAGPTSHDTLIKNNLLAGGGWTLYCPRPPTMNFQIIDNSFSTKFSPKVGGFGPATDCDGEIQSGNVYHETGLPLNLG